MALRLGPEHVGSRMAGPVPSSFSPYAVGQHASGQIASLTVDGKTWTFDDVTFFTGSVYSTALQIEVPFDATNFTNTVIDFTDPNAPIYTFEGIAPLNGITIKLTLYLTSHGLEFGAPRVFACPVGLAIVYIRFPYLHVFPHGALANNYGVLGASMIPQPDAKTAGVELGTMIVWEPALPIAGFYDADSKACLMLWIDDEAGNLVKIKMTGLTTKTLLYVEHAMDRRYTGGALSNKSYRVHLESFTGLTNRGEMVYQDFYDRFREWVSQPGRIATARGPWRDAVTVSSRIKTKGFVFNQGVGSSYYATDLLRMAGYLGGADKVLARWAFALNPDSTPPDQMHGSLLSPGYVAALNDVRTAGIDVSIYTLARLWLASLTGTFDPDAYAPFGDLKPLFMHDKTGAARITSGGYYTWDFSDAAAITVFLHVIATYYTLHSGEGVSPSALYLDAMSLYFDASAIEQEDDPADTAWSYSAHLSGIRSCATAVRDARRAIDPQHIMGTEVIDPFLIPAMDLMGDGRPGIGPSEAGNDALGGEYVYGEYVRFASLVGVGLWGNDPLPLDPGHTQASYLYPTVQALVTVWLYSGLVCVADRSTGGSQLVAADVENGNYLGPFWAYAKRLVSLALGPGAPYFRGRKARGLGSDYQVAVDSVLGQYELRVLLYGGPHPIQEAIWQAADGALGIFIAHCFQTGFTGPTLPTPGARTVTIALSSLAYGLSGVPKVLVRNDGAGNRTLVAKWVDSVEADVTVDEGTITLFEVLEDTGEEW